MINNLLKLSKEIDNKKPLDNYTIKYKEELRSCTDDMTIYLLIQGDEIIDASFEWDNSMVVNLYTSMIINDIIGRDLDYVFSLDDVYMDSILDIEISPRLKNNRQYGLLAIRNAINEYLKNNKS